ncbi:MAG: protoheme IX farnesyltransferase [Planctomycetes bacterium]|nr:protoheme IX farnesyltransferase [Planctomycetota bacterium]
MRMQPLEKSDIGGAIGTVPPLIAQSLPALLRMRFADYCILGKLRISVLVLIVTAIGFCLGTRGDVGLLALANAIIGTALVAIAANTLNQYMEREFDRLMIRTADRPIPAGRLTPAEAMAFGIVCGVVGLAYLWIATNPLATALAALTLFLYLFAYTPLKRRTAWNTWVGAVPGALPPMIGFAAAHNGLATPAWLLFAILFVWQLPHFFAIAWMYREDYARGGYQMLSTVDPSGRATRVQTVTLTMLMIVVSLAPSMLGFAGPFAGIGAVLLGAGLFVVAVRMAKDLSHATARTMLLATVIYLPLLMTLLVLDRSTP